MSLHNHTICIRAIVTGKVQGVFFRDSTRKTAQLLHVTGWVRNNKDGSVEIHACGLPKQIQTLIDWLHQGPPLAHVKQVQWSEIPLEEHSGFTTTRSSQ